MSQIRQYDILFTSASSPFVELTETLISGNTSLLFTDDRIHSGSVVAVYSDKFGLIPNTKIVQQGVISLTFPKQSRDIEVMVRFT
jgi:hypothetical protein